MELGLNSTPCAACYLSFSVACGQEGWRAEAWCQICWTNRYGKVFGLIWTSKIACVYAQPSTCWNVLVEFGCYVSAETVQASTLIGPHMTAEETVLSGDSSLKLGGMWTCGCPKSSVWSSGDVEGKK